MLPRKARNRSHAVEINLEGFSPRNIPSETSSLALRSYIDAQLFPSPRFRVDRRIPKCESETGLTKIGADVARKKGLENLAEEVELISTMRSKLRGSDRVGRHLMRVVGRID